METDAMSGSECKEGSCPLCDSIMAGHDEMMAKCRAILSSIGMHKDMIEQWDAMMRTPIFFDSPCTIFGLADRLELTPRQIQQIMDIGNNSRAEALNVLNNKQREVIGKFQDSPMPMMRMCKNMMGKMGMQVEDGP